MKLSVESYYPTKLLYATISAYMVRYNYSSKAVQTFSIGETQCRVHLKQKSIKPSIGSYHSTKLHYSFSLRDTITSTRLIKLAQATLQRSFNRAIK